MAHVGHSWLKTKPGSYKKVCERYHRFAEEIIAHNKDIHDVVIAGNPAQNTIEGFAIWENATHAANLEDTHDFAVFLADVESELAEPFKRNDLDLLFRMKIKV